MVALAREQRDGRTLGVATALTARASIALLAAVAIPLAAPFALPSVALAEPGPAQVFTQDNADLLREALNLSEEGDEGPAVLEADEIFYDSVAERVIAVGDVKIFYAERVLEADRVTYDVQNDEVTATGNVRLINPDGSVLVADNATFDTELRDGLIEGARAVLADGQARLAAVEGRRIDGRYTALSKVVYSPCEVCEETGVPLWQIRARRVVQDEESRDIIYEDATFEVFGQPVAWLPFFSHADPTVKRRTGLLTPNFFTNDNLGYVVQVPYYVEITPYMDATIIPWVITDDSPALGGEYRLQRRSGALRLGGTATWSQDDLEDGFRGNFDGDADFAIGDTPVGDDFYVGFDAEIASDDTFLRRYEIDGNDRLTQRAYVESYNRSGFTSLEAIRYQSFREDEPSGEIPMVLPHLELERLFDPSWAPGQFNLRTDSLYLRRTNDGQDVARLSGEIGWSDFRNTDYGLTFDSFVSVRGDLYRTFDGAVDDTWEGRGLPLAGVTIGYPLGKVTDTANHVIEPLASFVYAPYGGNPGEIPNEDSQDAELDELSIFEVNRFPGIDRWEDGPRATVGARYIRTPHNGGPEFDVSFGQSFRLRPSRVFTGPSGLRDTTSDFVGAWRVELPESFFIGHRFRISNDIEIERNEVYAEATFFDRLDLGGSYVFLEGDPETTADEDRSEANANARLALTNHWSVLGDVRRNIEDDQFVNAGGGLIYTDECCELGFTVRRRFNSVDDAPASTSVGLVLKLRGLGAE